MIVIIRLGSMNGLSILPDCKLTNAECIVNNPHGQGFCWKFQSDITLAGEERANSCRLNIVRAQNKRGLKGRIERSQNDPNSKRIVLSLFSRILFANPASSTAQHSTISTILTTKTSSSSSSSSPTDALTAFISLLGFQTNPPSFSSKFEYVSRPHDRNGIRLEYGIAFRIFESVDHVIQLRNKQFLEKFHHSTGVPFALQILTTSTITNSPDILICLRPLLRKWTLSDLLTVIGRTDIIEFLPQSAVQPNRGAAYIDFHQSPHRLDFDWSCHFYVYQINHISV